MDVAYQACLWSRLANRILLSLGQAEAKDSEQLYDLAMSVDWGMHMASRHRFKVDFRGTYGALKHEQYSARVVKDAIVDQFREQGESRPEVDLKEPDIWLVGYLHKGVADLYLDLSGPSLHRRGYRIDQGEAPIKENLAAALLYRAGWPEMSEQSALIDPLCGSATLLIEGLLIRADIAPGLYRENFGFEQWLGHQESLWQTMRDAAEQRAEQGRQALANDYIGFEVDKRTRRAAMANIGKLGVEEHIRIIGSDFNDSPKELPSGLIISNPPYGERLGDVPTLMPVYQKLGKWLKQQTGSKAAIICSEPELMQQTEIRASKRYKFYNGKLACQLYCFELETDNFQTRERNPDKLPHLAPLINRLRKNLVKVVKWAENNDLQAFRIYDHDLPEYAFAVDQYAQHLVVYESAAPASISEHKVHKHRREMLMVLKHVCQLPSNNIILKTRQRQKGTQQYEAASSYHQQTKRIQIREQGLKFWVNLVDYLDTGLFIDHRKIRSRIQQLAKDQSVLNLFCYTATVSVYAAAGGARSVTNVDLSNTYLDWAKDNLSLNGFDVKSQSFIKANVIDWLDSTQTTYDLIFLDPPSFSNSKAMAKHFDIQAHHDDLIQRTMKHLSLDGMMIFSTNKRGFKLDKTLQEHFLITDLQTSTISPDFRTHRPPHHCWEFRHKNNT
jgi:23S rRNA (guanine2445-N2)-methyltransferase / 23S rRNA (guanine2069-N7)-methyltransferase